MLRWMRQIQSGDQWSPSGERPLVAALYRKLLESIGMRDTWLGMSMEQAHAYGDRMGVMHHVVSGADHAAQLKPFPALNSESAITTARPASNARGPIRELGCFYEMLLN